MDRAKRTIERLKDKRAGRLPILRLLLVEDTEPRLSGFEKMIKLAHVTDFDVKVVWAKSAGAAIGLLARDKGRVYGGIMLDHDLTEQERSNDDHMYNGSDVTNAIIEYVDNDVPVFVHSANITGGPKMAAKLRLVGFPVVQMPYSLINLSHFKAWVREVCEAAAC